MKTITLKLACQLLGYDLKTVLDEHTIHEIEDELRERLGGQWEMDVTKQQFRKVFY